MLTQGVGILTEFVQVNATLQDVECLSKLQFTHWCFISADLTHHSLLFDCLHLSHLSTFVMFLAVVGIKHLPALQ